MPLSLTEALLVAALCLLAIRSRARGPMQRNRNARRNTGRPWTVPMRIIGAPGRLRAWKGSQRDVCFREAKAIYIRATADAKARPVQNRSAGL